MMEGAKLEQSVCVLYIYEQNIHVYIYDTHIGKYHVEKHYFEC